MLEDFLNMISDQGANKSDMFNVLKASAIEACDDTVSLLRSEPNGRLSDKERNRIARSAQLFGQQFYRQFVAEKPLSMLICLIVDQLSFMKPGRKQEAFERLLHETENLMVCFDPMCEYADQAGFDAALVLDKLEL